MRNYLVAASLLCSLASGLPFQGTKSASEARGLMDEALKKFYFDLYDGDEDGQDAPGNADSQSFNIDDYFETNDNVKEQKIKLATDRSASINQQYQQPPPVQKQFLPPQPQTQQHPSPFPIVPSQSQAAPAPASGSQSSQDPTFVLSRLLFHLSQLPGAGAQ